MSRKLQLSDIADLRAYERERPTFLAQVVDLKRRRRVALGPYLTLVFENRDTVRFQIQEMARVERLMTDEAIEGELAVYNPLVPEAGELCATLFVELTSDEALREWLPKLVGIERTLSLLAGDIIVAASVEEDHASRLTRSDITSTVHYLRWELDLRAVEAVAAGPVWLRVSHPAYAHEVELTGETTAELVTDLAG